MRAVVQRVGRAQVAVGERIVASIGPGLLILVGVGEGDTEADAGYIARKVAELRIFSDDVGKINRSVGEVDGSALVVSQFTLYGDCRWGCRPSFDRAMQPEPARRLVDLVCALLRQSGSRVETGEFERDDGRVVGEPGPGHAPARQPEGVLRTQTGSGRCQATDR